MSHIRLLSRTPQRAQSSGTTAIESAIITLMSIFFGDWVNGPTVIQFLSGFYAKTPDNSQ